SFVCATDTATTNSWEVNLNASTMDYVSAPEDLQLQLPDGTWPVGPVEEDSYEKMLFESFVCATDTATTNSWEVNLNASTMDYVSAPVALQLHLPDGTWPVGPVDADSSRKLLCDSFVCATDTATTNSWAVNLNATMMDYLSSPENVQLQLPDGTWPVG